MEKAGARIRTSAHCSGLPYALLHSDHPALRESLLALQNLSLRAGLVPALWYRQPVYMKGKPHKAKMEFEGYRQLGLSTLEAHVQEELWLGRCAETLSAGLGNLQDGMGECLTAALLDQETRATLAAQGRPCGDFHSDEREAFDSQSRPEALLALHDRGSIHGRYWLLAAEMMAQTKLWVTADGIASSAFHPGTGMPQGRVLSPIGFCLAQAEKVESIDASPGIGVGLDPPTVALEAYRRFKDGSDADEVDNLEVQAWQSLLAVQPEAWERAMQNASSDAVRLRLLDVASSVRVGARAFVDDSRAKVASRAQCRTTLAAYCRAEQTYQGRLRYGPGKTAIQAEGILDSRQVGQAVFQDSYECLGVWRGTGRAGEKHLRELARVCESTGIQHVSALLRAELGFCMARDCVELATLPAILYGAELCAHLPDFEKTVNRAQEQLARKLLGISGPAPRAVILHEVGWSSRWSTTYRARAAMLWTRINTDSRYSDAARVCAVAADHPGTWSCWVVNWLRDRGIEALGEAAPSLRGAAHAARKRQWSTYNTRLVQPAAAAEDEAWRAQEPQRGYLQAHGTTRWRACDLAEAGAPDRSLRAWAALRVTGGFERTLRGARIPCRLCGAEEETASHLIQRCQRAGRHAAAWAGRLGVELPDASRREEWWLGGCPAADRLAVAELSRHLSDLLCS